MGNPLAGVAYKFSRAEEHREKLNRVIGNFLERRAYTITREDHEGELSHTRVRVKTVEPPPAALAVLIGEVLYSFRSGLDHMAFELAILNHGSPLPDHFANTSAFPLKDSSRKFRDVQHQIGGMAPEARTAIERLQPYHRRKHPELRALGWLERLCNIDKHRSLHVVDTHLAKSIYEVSGPGRAALIDTGVSQRTMKPGAQLAHFVLDWSRVPRDKRQMHMTLRLARQISFERGAIQKSAGPASVAQTLQRISDVIHDRVLPGLMRFFPPEARFAFHPAPIRQRVEPFSFMRPVTRRHR